MLTSRTLRIEMVLPSLVAAGMETVVSRLALALAERGHDVGVTCIEDEGVLAAPLRAAGVAVSLVREPGVVANLRPRQLSAWFSERKPDIVHVHSGAWLKAARAARLTRTPRVVHTVHGLLDQEPWHGPPLKRIAARYTDRIVTVSEPLRQYLVHSVGLAPAKIEVLVNGVDTDVFTPDGPTARDTIAPGLGGGAIIGHVARLAPVKNQVLLIDAFARIAPHHPTATLVLVGEGPERDALEARVAEHGLAGRVHLAGEHSDLPPIYRAFDVFVLSSNAEGTSMSALEAMASGVCVVATDVGGNPDVLDAGRCGVLVPPRDPAALATALDDILRAPERRYALGAAGRRRVDEAYSHRAMIDRYEAIYYGTAPSAAPHHPSPPHAVCAE